jgi:hypothetical protein
MDMDGLAQQMVGPAAGGAGQLPTVEEVIQLLMQGIDPQELLQMGIPEELLLQALQILEQQAGAAGGGAQPMGPPADAGLAQSMAG